VGIGSKKAKIINGSTCCQEEGSLVDRLEYKTKQGFRIILNSITLGKGSTDLTSLNNQELQPLEITTAVIPFLKAQSKIRPMMKNMKERP
jgi:hypothetical protein